MDWEIADKSKQPQEACPESPAYSELMDKFFSNSYNIMPKPQRQELLHKYDCQIHSLDDAVAMANLGLKTMGDRYTYAMTPSEYAKSQQILEGYFEGLGITFTNAILGLDGKPIVPKTLAQSNSQADEPPKDSQAIIFDTIANSPARAAGLKKGDMITAIDGHDTRAMRYEDLSGFLGGPVGENHHLTISRDGEILEKDVTRAHVPIPAVEDPKDLGEGIVYIRINDFNDETPERLQAAMKLKENANAFVIDVRNNPGGFVESAVGSAELFIEKGNILSARGRQPSDPDHPKYSTTTYSVDEKESHHKELGDGIDFSMSDSRHPWLTKDKHVVVLTNDGTISGAEAFTGALHDSGQAITVGETTYGKGIGQIVKKFDDGSAVKVTQLEYFTPSGNWPGDAGNNAIGLTPDYKVSNAPSVEFGSKDDEQLNFGVRILMAKMQEQH